MQSSLSSIFKIISDTPIWVWCILGYLIFTGIRAIKPRVVYIPKIFVIPLVFSALNYKVFVASSILVWLGYFMCLFLLSFLSYKYCAIKKIEIIKESASVKLPGTYWTLVILVTFFIVKYVFGYISATNPRYYHNIQFLELGIGAVLSGYFLGRGIRYLMKLKMSSI